MSGRKLLFDSNIVIYVAKKQLIPDDFVQPEDVLYISDISYMETLGYTFESLSEKRDTEELLSVLIRLPLTEPIVQKVIEIRQSKRMKLPDAIIAATAIIHECLLVTRNVSDFSNISDLMILNP